ncbi:hypothetical protein [Azospirillum tabaci]|uniref:hypothetical protein n=1 Tax=Azospirillum tabaci TaxID=2752310 RepID=UPI0016609767|nr:hypothetical protein [Azospirillum tabaci]
MKSMRGLWASLILTCSSALPLASEALSAQALIVGTTNVGQSTVCGVPIKVEAVEHKDLMALKSSYFVRVTPLDGKIGDEIDLNDADVNIINTAITNAPKFGKVDYKTDSGVMTVERAGLWVVARSGQASETLVQIFYKGRISKNCDAGSLQELRRLLLDALSAVISMRK